MKTKAGALNTGFCLVKDRIRQGNDTMTNDQAQLYWQSPAAVRVGTADGREQIIMFSTRLEAEQFVYLLPLMQANGYADAEGVTWAMLAESGVGLN